VLVQSDGAPAASVAVTWQVSAGTIAPASGATDAAGLASATWTLGAVAGSMTASTTVAGAQGSPVTFKATALPPPVTATAVPATDGQAGVVGAALPLPLCVLVQFAGVPHEGVTVVWHSSSSDGAVTPGESVTDRNGFASATWTLGTAAGDQQADATTTGPVASRASFNATARPGPGAIIDTVQGRGRSSPANRRQFGNLTVVVTDRYGNLVDGQAVTWTVESGPVAFSMVGGPTGADGQSTAYVEPSGTTGDAVVRAALTGGTASVSFALTALPPVYQVVLDNYVFRSSQNGSRAPAVDTIPVGATMQWLLDPFDYDVHRVESVGSPSFQGGDLPYANPSTLSVTFPTPGTYQYNDFYYPDDRGTIVVR
jgi:plastocyanin